MIRLTNREPIIGRQQHSLDIELRDRGIRIVDSHLWVSAATESIVEHFGSKSSQPRQHR